MDLTTFDIVGPKLLAARVFKDNRGFFTERFRNDVWSQIEPGHRGFIQDNYSWSKYGVLRGLHFQINPGQGKLVSCVHGSILDVIVDIRSKSNTLGKYIAMELTGVEPKWLWVPPGFAHGFLVTSPGGAAVLYKVDQPYSPQSEHSLLWSDKTLNIDWPVKEPIISEKDSIAPSFSDYLTRPLY